MAELPLYQRNELPPGRTGAALVPYSLADRSAQQQLGATIAEMGEDNFDRLVEARAANEKHEFIGSAVAEMETFNSFIESNPGAAIEDLQKEQKEMMARIKASASRANTGLGKEFINGWMTENQPIIESRTTKKMKKVLAEQERQRSDMNLEAAINRFDKDAAADLIRKQAGKSYPEEVADQLIAEAHAEIDILKKKTNTKSLKEALESEALDIAAANGWEAGFELVESAETAKKLSDSGLALEEQQKIREDLKSRMSYEKAKAETAKARESEQQRGLVYDAIDSGSVPDDFDGDMRDYIESMGDLSEDEQERLWNIATEKMQSGSSPLEKHDPQTYLEISRKIRNNPEDVTESDIFNLVGKGQEGGISTQQYEDLHNIWKESRTGKSDPVKSKIGQRYARALNSLQSSEALTGTEAEKVQKAAQIQEMFDKWQIQNPEAPVEDFDKFFQTALGAVDMEALIEFADRKTAEQVSGVDFGWWRSDDDTSKAQGSLRRKVLGNNLTEDVMAFYLRQADNDIEQAKKLAQKDGYDTER